MIEDLFAYHLVLVLLTPTLLATAAAPVCLLVRHPALAWVAVGPAVALQVLLLARLDLLDQLDGPAVHLLRPHPLSISAGLTGVILLVWHCRPSRRGDGWRRPAGWRWCLQVACILGLPLIPLPGLIPGMIACFHGRRPAWCHPFWAWFIPVLALVLSPLWLIGPITASVTCAGLFLLVAGVLPRDRRTFIPVTLALVHLAMTW